MNRSDYRDPRLTEQRNPRTERIDVASTLEIVDLLNGEDATVAARCVPCAPSWPGRSISWWTLRPGGRLIYVGAGTSGRLGARREECPPTFGTPPEMSLG